MGKDFLDDLLAWEAFNEGYESARAVRTERAIRAVQEAPRFVEPGFWGHSIDLTWHAIERFAQGAAPPAVERALPALGAARPRARHPAP